MIVRTPRISSVKSASVFLLVLSVTLAGCLSPSERSTYYGRVVVPHAQEFRWSDGGLPQTFDPAFAAAPPDTDAVRALFEGLTDYDPQTLAPIPAVATHWESSADGRVWTFYLRDDAKWSNGEPVTASDFVRSWERTLRIGPLAPHTELLSNIEGSGVSPKATSSTQTNRRMGFGAEAVSDHVLRVRLHEADARFAELVAHPVFRPVKLPVTPVPQTHPLEPRNLVSNGAFLLTNADNERVLMERANTYWDGASVSLDRVSFVSSANAEEALAAYRAGSVDAVTNAAFEPLALKLLAAYKDFRRSTFGALTYYSFNISRAPFDDVRVREALAIAIDREHVSRDNLGGATEPAGKFIPEEMSGEMPVVNKTELLELDMNKARQLFADAGFPNGEGFPVIRLLINRNEQQRTVAQAIASMWHNVLNVQTEIVIKNWDEYEAALGSGDYDVVRRGMVMQTTDQLTNLNMLFEREETTPTADPSSQIVKRREAGKSEKLTTRSSTINSEEDALKELRAFPVYFASSFALVKPYVTGFDGNILDAPSLKKTRMDTAWLERKP